MYSIVWNTCKASLINFGLFFQGRGRGYVSKALKKLKFLLFDGTFTLFDSLQNENEN